MDTASWGDDLHNPGGERIPKKALGENSNRITRKGTAK